MDFQEYLATPPRTNDWWKAAEDIDRLFGPEAVANAAWNGYWHKWFPGITYDMLDKLGGYVSQRQDEQSGNDFNLGGLGLGYLGLGGVAGLTGAALATGNDPKTAAALDLAGLAAAPALGAAGLGTVAGAGAAEGAAVGAGAAGAGAGGAIPAAIIPEAAGAAPALGAAEGGSLAGGSMSGATSGGMAGAATAGAAGAGTGTALSRLLDGDASTADYLGLAGILGATGLGVYGANRQSQALEDLNNKYMAMGEPSRGRYEASFAPGFTMANDPGYTDALNQAAKSTLHGLSAKVGNPSDSPNAWAQTLQDLYKGTAYPALHNYRTLNANAGGLSRFADAAPGVATGAINADANKLNAIGAGAADIFNPPKSQSQLLRELFRG